MPQSEVNPSTSHTLTIWAEYHQIFVRDEEAEEDIPDEWGKQLVEDMIAVAPGIVGIGTARNTRVPVQIGVFSTQPDDDFTEWDQVVEATIEVPSGQLILAGPSDYLPDAQRLPVTSGVYRIRVYYSGLDTLSDDGLKGNDRYQIFLWADEESPLKILKRRKP